MLKIYYQFEKYDKDFQRIGKTHKRRGRSFVENFMKCLYAQTSEASISATDITSSAQSISGTGGQTSTFQFVLNSTSSGRKGSCALFTRSTPNGVSATNVGIQLGTGTTAVTPTDVVLATPIADGTSAGQLEYFPCSGTGLTVSNPTGTFTIERLFRNSSGGSITVNEMGLYSMGSWADPPKTYCTIRDIVSPGFAIADGEYARAIYTLTITV